MTNRGMPIAIVLTLQFIFASPVVEAGQATAKNATGPVPVVVSVKLQALFQKYYPKATYTNLNSNGLQFEYNVTMFAFSPADPTKKHEAPVQRGPKKGGILCRVYLEEGEYRGQIALAARPGDTPQSNVIDRKAYKQLLAAPYSAKRDAHLWISLSYPPDTSDDFLNGFQAIMKAFEQDSDIK